MSAVPPPRFRGRGSSKAAARRRNGQARASRRSTAPRRSATAGALQVGQCAQRLLVVRLGVPAMNLVQVDPVRLEALQARLDLLKDPAARVALLVRVGVVHLSVHLRREHDRVAPALQGLADDLLRFAASVDIRGVDEVDPGVERGVDGANAFVVVGVAPRAEHHCAEAEWRDLHAGLAELASVHVSDHR